MMKNDETVEQFVMRLKRASDGGNSERDLENQIGDQVVQHCRSDNLRRKLLEKGDRLTLAQTIKISSLFETVEVKFQEMKLDAGRGKSLSISSSHVNKITQRGKRRFRPRKRDKECFRCGYL